MNLMETIHLHKNDFSKTERKVYDYIVQKPTAIETATITKIAELCQVSTSGILRFCQVLGYKGYKDFRFDMLHYLHQEHVEVNSENLFDELTSKYLSVIRQFNNIDQNKLNQLIKQIKNTKNIYIIEGNQNNVSRFFDLTNASKNTYMITLNPKPKLLIENTLILPGYTLSKQSIVDLQSIVVIFVELLLNMFHNTLKED